MKAGIIFYVTIMITTLAIDAISYGCFEHLLGRGYFYGIISGLTIALARTLKEKKLKE